MAINLKQEIPHISHAASGGKEEFSFQSVGDCAPIDTLNDASTSVNGSATGLLKKCKFFRCVEEEKEHCTESSCSGCGGEGYLNCGCDYCEHQSYVGDAIICDIAIGSLESEMEETE